MDFTKQHLLRDGVSVCAASGDYCDLCQSAFSLDGFVQILEPNRGFLHHDFTTLEKNVDSCPLCAVIFNRIHERLYYLGNKRELMNIVLRIETKPGCNGLSHGPTDASPMHVLSISMRSVEFSEYVKDDSDELNIFAYEGDPAASWILTRPPELDVASIKTTERVKEMVSECHSHHAECRTNTSPRLPTRVIDVQKSSSPMVHLHIPDEDCEYDEYLTLSYCWGGDQTFLALKDNLGALKSGFALSTLPQTLQDAVQTTRQLGYHYLWVDALCIIQDDEEDMAREIAAMADIYNNSTATILAATSSSMSKGYLNHPRRQPSFITLPVNLPNGEKGHIGISETSERYHFTWDTDPLSQRGWALQEFLLAKRILFYGPYEVLFGCQGLGFARLFPSYINYPDDQQPSSRSLFYSQDRAASWSEIVRQYTCRRLTFPEDRIHAIAGIVLALERLWDDKCIFGAWTSWFLEQMTWFNAGGTSRRSSLRRSNRAPSWAWLSIDSPVKFFCSEKLQPDCIITADLRKVATGARLTLSCQVIPHHEWPTLKLSNFDVHTDVENKEESEGISHFYLYLGSKLFTPHEQWRNAYALVVIEEETDVFRRIGLGTFGMIQINVIRDFEQGLQPRRNITLI